LKNMLRNNSDMPKTLKNKMVSGNPRPYSIYIYISSVPTAKKKSLLDFVHRLSTYVHMILTIHTQHVFCEAVRF